MQMLNTKLNQWLQESSIIIPPFSPDNIQIPQNEQPESIPVFIPPPSPTERNPLPL